MLRKIVYIQKLCWKCGTTTNWVHGDQQSLLLLLHRKQIAAGTGSCTMKSMQEKPLPSYLCLHCSCLLSSLQSLQKMEWGRNPQWKSIFLPARPSYRSSWFFFEHLQTMLRAESSSFHCSSLDTVSLLWWGKDWTDAPQSISPAQWVAR